MFFALCLVGLLSGGFLLLDETDAGSPPDDIVVEMVHANLLRVRVAGVWQQVPLMPLADHLCQSDSRLFDKYCGEDAVAPQ
ncbi:MAG: hypothetical protein A2289_22850 [Deltaproteobacteria bacterium RIFOXYA12_FULL_58_15]|nr:MAG: hypothetical protein A2289_22850 [Deltaproteobacteria bacterium RIFOXYA12_FULL_58_15]